MVSAPVDRYQCAKPKRIGSWNKRFYGFIRYKSSSAETQGRSVGSGKTAAKVFKNGREPWDTALNEPDPRILVLDWVQKKFWYPIRGQDLNVSRCFRDLLIRRSSPPALSWRRAFSFSRKMSPQSLIYQFHSILLQRWGEKFNKFTNFKGREIFSCTCLTSLPSRLTKSTTWKISHEQA